MRCVAGLALFLALYFSSCNILSGAVRSNSGPTAAAEALRKYHAAIAVAAGVVSLTLCCLPGVLARKSQEAEWREWEQWNSDPE
jgi:hypothetical protein